MAVKPIPFGPFEADLNSQELRKRGVRLRLPRQSFQILKMLLGRPGELVTREEMRQALWPSDTFVDFEHGLNAAINRLREALGDDAENPRYVETLPRRGYRFTGTITQLEPAAVTIASGEGEKEEPSAKANKRKLWAPVAALFGLFALSAFGFYWFRLPLPAPRVLRYKQLTADRQLKFMNPCGFGSTTVTDGPRVFFSELSASLAQVDSGGGDAVKISTPIECFIFFDISPAKTELLGISLATGFAADKPLWVLSIANGLARRLGNLEGHAAAWSPDGQSIVYATGNNPSGGNTLYITAKDGGEARKLVAIENGFVALIRWSPNGKLLRMIVTHESSGQSSSAVWEVSSDGSNPHAMKLFPGEDRLVLDENWTADGKYFLFTVGKRSTFSADLWALRETNSFFSKSTAKPIQLTPGAMSFWNPTPKPDGKQVFAIGGQNRGELVRYDLKSQKFEPFLNGISAEQVDFSKDGKWVTYVTFPDCVLWRSRTDGGERMQLINSPLLASLPRWSPDGKRIAFSGLLPGGIWRTYVVSAEGGKPEMVSKSEDEEFDPTWLPDGHSLIVGGGIQAQAHISSVDLQTGRLSLIPGSTGKFSPRVSPDGRYITAIEAPSDLKVLLFDQQTQKWSELMSTKLPGTGWQKWSTDSKYLYVFNSRDSHAPVLYRVRVADGKIEQVAEFKIPEGLTGFWTGWMGLTADGSPLMLRDLSIQEIYALDVDLP